MLNFALKYLNLGLSVIPLKPCGKEPLISWAEFQKRRATEKEVREWYAKWPEANIGIVTGSLSGVIVIDLDGPEGISQALKLGLSSSVVAMTGNGRHLWYSFPKDGKLIQNSASKIAPGIDIRGEGGFIVGPPSVHENGKRYRWLKPFGLNGLSPFPQELIAFAENTNGKLISGNKAETWLEEALEDFKNGHVSNTLISILGKFRAHNFSQNTVYELLNPHNTSGELSNEELREKIEEIWGRYEPSTKSVAPSESRTIAEFLEKEIPVKWICKPFFSVPSLNFIAGLPESLKSWLAIDLAIELARGGMWLNKFQTQKCRVYYLDQERAVPETQRRFKALLAEKGLDKKDLTNLFADCSSHRKMDLDVSFESFKNELRRIRPDVIIVDSFVTFHTKPENDRMEIQKVLDRLKLIREEFNCAMVFINHESKSAYQDQVDHNEPSAGRMVGSIGVVAAAESILSVKKINSYSSNVYQTKNSLSNPVEAFTIEIKDTDSGIKLSANEGAC